MFWIDQGEHQCQPIFSWRICPANRTGQPPGIILSLLFCQLKQDLLHLQLKINVLARNIRNNSAQQSCGITGLTLAGWRWCRSRRWLGGWLTRLMFLLRSAAGQPDPARLPDWHLVNVSQSSPRLRGQFWEEERENSQHFLSLIREKDWAVKNSQLSEAKSAKLYTSIHCLSIQPRIN